MAGALVSLRHVLRQILERWELVAPIEGDVSLNGFMEMYEITAPAAPTTNKGRLFVRDNGAGKSQLCIRFPTGDIQVIATEP